MRSTRWMVFHDAEGWYLATVKGKPSRRMNGKEEAELEAAKRNVRIAAYERAVLERRAGPLPSPAN